MEYENWLNSERARVNRVQLLRLALPSTAAAMEAAAVESPAGDMKATAESQPSASGKTSDPAMVEAVEAPVTHAECPVPHATMNATGMSERHATAIEAGLICEGPAIGTVRAIVVDNTASTPICTPMVPAPAKSGEGPYPNAEAEQHVRIGHVQPG
jgi:hypothetical protein